MENVTPWIRARLLGQGCSFESMDRIDREFDNPDDQRRNAATVPLISAIVESFVKVRKSRGRMVRTNYDANGSKPAEISVDKVRS